MSKLEKYTAHSQVADALRIETSVVSPSVQQELVSHGRRVVNFMSERYGLTQLSGSNLPDRIVVTDDAGYNTFIPNWLSSFLTGEEKYSPAKQKDLLTASYMPEGGILLLNGETALWDHLDGSHKDQLIAQSGTESMARVELERIVMQDSVTHEILHEVVGGNLSDGAYYIAHPAVFYYLREIAQALNFPYLTTPRIETEIDFYQYLLNKYGKVFEDYMFSKGNNMDEWDLVRLETAERLRLFVQEPSGTFSLGLEFPS